ncbi:Hypothetical protein, conserved [Brucella abortus str. 2308 A]|uniref:Uncharacterized protein n=3 Tax=Brucella TaxID=234 RepID=C0RLL0_BRUMB|nr:Hypothetical protein, conserved [Brucella canis ATCC 23365]ACO02493.1 Hypothetical protein, conserved [Brucella melitensis ATCC 23457]EEH12725.1 Hypothetical protein, conserved [Brucella ceti str. Cudo]EEP62036.1 Hypothetical protein, conserved [Brucella abortus str. 2308 A]
MRNCHSKRTISFRISKCKLIRLYSQAKITFWKAGYPVDSQAEQRHVRRMSTCHSIA